MGPTFAQIDHAALRHNFRLIQKKVDNRKVMAVVKANAYGHGANEVAQTLLAAGAAYLGVAFAEEGIALRKAGITSPVLVFGATLPETFETILINRLDITITQTSQLQSLISIANKLKIRPQVHLKFESGMHRVGLFYEELLKCLWIIEQEENINLLGIYSHLSSADEDDPAYTNQQILAFKKLKEEIGRVYNGQPLFHLANSAAIMQHPQALFDMVRPGIILYGNPPSSEYPIKWPLQEVMSLRSKVTLIKKVLAGSALSYGRRYITKTDTKIAIIPVGYADGLNRLLTNRGPLLIRGKRYHVSGTICMDQIVVDLGPDSEVKIGDEVVFFGRQGTAAVSISEISRLSQTIPYETTCQISPRVQRRHINRII